MGGSLVSRNLTVVFTLGEIPGTKTTPAIPLYFQPGNSKSVELTGRATEATITQAGSYAMSQAEITIYNAPLSIANAVASYGQPLYYMNRNTVALLAGDDQAGMSLAFEGNITEAAVDFTQTPNLAFNVTAATGIDAAMTPVVPLSYKGRVDVVNIIAQIAATMGFAFENDGVSCIISNPYLQGTALNQLQLIARAANINYFLDRGTLAIWPKNVARGSSQGKPPVPVGPDTGLYGYPTYTTFGCMFRTLYNPMLDYGSAVKVTSSLPPAQGEWIVYNLAHVLSAQVREGDWFSDVLVARAGGVPAVT